MKLNKIYISIATVGMLIGASSLAAISDNNAPKSPAKNVIDEVIWIVGDEAIFRSEIEEMYAQMRSEGQNVPGDPYCVIPEQLAVEKLYLHQAKIDTVEAPENQVQNMVDKRLNFFIANLGSREKVEEYFRKPYTSLRESLLEMMRNNYIVEQVQSNITKDVKATPKEVQKWFESLPEDSIPYVPMQVETQIVSLNPTVPQQEIDDIKARLRDYAERVNSGQSDFSTLAIMYSDDGSAMQGGELGFHGRADFVPEFSNVAFNLSDPKKVSRIVETEFGYHIIQLIEKRGDQVNVRHILLRPRVSSQELRNSVQRLDSVRKEIISGKLPFETAARLISQDKDTRNNNGVMMNQRTGSSRFEMQDLPAEVAKAVEKLQPGELTDAFVMMDVSKNKEIAAIVRLTNRIPGHKATIAEDYNLLKQMYENYKKQQLLREWLEKKIKDTYVHIEDGWQNCDFQYEGWVK